MRIIEQHHTVLAQSAFPEMTIEKAGRTCYKSEKKITTDSAPPFTKMLIKRGHTAMIEFADMTVRFVTNRGVTHELVRHRLCSFAQESTRYVNYGVTDIEFIKPVWTKIQQGTYQVPIKEIEDMAEIRFAASCLRAERDYKDLLSDGWRPEQAREILPNALKTEIVVKANVREWRHIFSLRCSKKAHPQMRSLMLPLLHEMIDEHPALFGDLGILED